MLGSSRSYGQVETVKRYTENYTRAHGLPIPGCLPNARDNRALTSRHVEDVCVLEVCCTKGLQESQLIYIGVGCMSSGMSLHLMYIAVMKFSLQTIT